jgi:hypothetical protein
MNLFGDIGIEQVGKRRMKAGVRSIRNVYADGGGPGGRPKMVDW